MSTFKHVESIEDLKTIIEKKDEKNKTEIESNKAELQIQSQKIDDLKDQMRRKDEVIEIMKSENQNHRQETEELKTEMRRMKESRNDIIQQLILKVLKEKEIEENKRREFEEENKRRESIPSRCLSKEQFKELNKICGFDNSWKLLFRGSENGFKSSTFHSRCDNIPGTLTIIKTDENYVLGGFNPVRWNEVNNAYYKANGAWIFGFIKENNQEKIIKINYDGTKNFGIKCDPSFGPIFGGGNAIYLYNDCSINDYSYTNLSQGEGYPNGGRGDHFLNGGTEYFKVLEYEVYSK